MRKKLSQLGKSYKAVKVASNVDSSSSDFVPAFVPEKISEQIHRPAKFTGIDIAKTQHGVPATLVADRLRSVQNISDADSP